MLDIANALAKHCSKRDIRQQTVYHGAMSKAHTAARDTVKHTPWRQPGQPLEPPLKRSKHSHTNRPQPEVVQLGKRQRHLIYYISSV